MSQLKLKYSLDTQKDNNPKNTSKSILRGINFKTCGKVFSNPKLSHIEMLFQAEPEMLEGIKMYNELGS